MVFKNLRHKLKLPESKQVPDEKDLLIDLGIVHVNNEESISPSWKSYSEQIVAYRNTNFEELKTLFDITQRLILEHAFEILEAFHDDDIYFAT